VLTSFPPKRHLTFAVDGRLYESNVVLHGTDALLTPTR
jgi:hypothetical protein